VITGHAEPDIAVGDTTVHVETGGEGNNPDAVKRFVDAKIAISPDDVNGIGETHSFVVDVDNDLGDGAGSSPPHPRPLHGQIGRTVPAGLRARSGHGDR
jgi:hypothetical protein